MIDPACANHGRILPSIDMQVCIRGAAGPFDRKLPFHVWQVIAFNAPDRAAPGPFTKEDEFLMANFGSNAMTVIEKYSKNKCFQWFISQKDMLIDSDCTEWGKVKGVDGRTDTEGDAVASRSLEAGGGEGDGGESKFGSLGWILSGQKERVETTTTRMTGV
uniref:Uncharacterized protein n=1 Tax=Chromera velia CCMP2878 TaxID=1169474 RepID=A0A0G4HQ26_9ALVE|eukprot:Cvel_30149.t1-p1 / transcript=Cvel_30149.t1 / gene=Cvel_30149 / organism=Chromera_velia_CCMP2878 / gene_product=hypothetical protein / transcript_product=hypothetical protein / location=Cvel_scaffold4257:4469-9347(+) / protein_length=160 / sequence_SO=supercontig / SO=protein_coding / is_pseudo=false